jgi:hypothetical protein
LVVLCSFFVYTCHTFDPQKSVLFLFIDYYFTSLLYWWKNKEIEVTEIFNGK